MKFGIKDCVWDSLANVFAHFPNIKRALLFGSRAKGNYKPFSDIDIALVGPSLCIKDILRLQTEIDDLLLPYEFDFCIYDHIENAELKDHIDRRGIEIYSRKEMV